MFVKKEKFNNSIQGATVIFRKVDRCFRFILCD